MHLKSLTVLGFKSFADKTTLNFQPGVSAIVGPNGCGKSNVSDAIRWVLGEQSAKALRGGEMSDVIFNGTDGRKPLGMAEVSLTMADVDRDHLKAAGVEIEFDEVMVTRRVFRDGGSEYFINKVPCRLKDIQQLFMGTGVGRTSYSIMAQGNITQLLSSKPEDRRLVFEEAAGITKFKSQKKEALRKLEYTEQNLLRVSDLIREVKRQIGSLQRQAGKARRYKQIMVELQHLDTQLARHHFDVFQGELTERQTRVEQLRTEIEGCSENVMRGEHEIAQLRERLTELEHRISESQQRGVELKSEIDRHDSRIHFNEQRLHELEQQNGQALGDIAQGEERRLVAEQELAVVVEQLAVATAGIEQHRLELNQRREALQQVERELESQQVTLRNTQSETFGAAQQLTRVRNEITALDLQKQGNVVRLEKLSAEKIQLEEERTRLEIRLQEFSQNVEAEKLNVQVSRGTVEQRQQRLRELQQELTVAAQELDNLLRSQAVLRSQLTVLEQLEESHEGFSTGALAALKQSQSVLGSLADRIRVPAQYVTAIETALGHHLQLVLTEQPDAAHAIIADLANNKRGRASIAALGLKNDVVPPVAPESAASLVRAHAVIESDPSVQALLNGLLGQTVVVENLAAATEAWKATNGAFDFVTHNGELLTRHGVFTGGASNGKGAASILGRKNQIAELRQQLTTLQEKVTEGSRQKGAIQSEQTELQASLQEAQVELRTQEVAIATRQGEFRALENSQRVLHQKIDTVVYEVQSLADHEREGAARRQALADQVSQQEERERGLQVRLAELNAQIEALRQQRDEVNATLTEAKITLASEEQLCSSLRNQQQPLQQRIAELTQLVAQRQREISSVVDRKTQAEREIVESRGRIEALQHERGQVSTQTAELIGQRDVLNADIAGREDALRDQRRQLEQNQQQRGTLEVEIAQKQMSVQNLRERIQQKYHLNLDDIRSECINITYADEGPAKVVTLTPEEMAASGAATDWDVVGQQVEALQKRVDEMGPVNLVAIEEYEETEQRHQFLTKQYDDLISAKTQLIEVINRINVQTQEMFTQTFNLIRDNFRTLFTEIFGGGKADLILQNEGDVLESGIDIVARPPGKQLQTISLLSGGEQTMTAVALLFSIYQVKPSPFCVLDELDAPLDESNINRFLRVLQRFLEQSQFIIITHNKRTIGMADVLYGVTMEEHGISKIVSVKFHKTHDEVTDRSTPLVPLASNMSSVDKEADAPHKREDTVEIVMAK